MTVSVSFSYVKCYRYQWMIYEMNLYFSAHIHSDFCVLIVKWISFISMNRKLVERHQTYSWFFFSFPHTDCENNSIEIGSNELNLFTAVLLCFLGMDECKWMLFATYCWTWLYISESFLFFLKNKNNFHAYGAFCMESTKNGWKLVLFPYSQLVSSTTNIANSLVFRM